MGSWIFAADATVLGHVLRMVEFCGADSAK